MKTIIAPKLYLHIAATLTATVVIMLCTWVYFDKDVGTTVTFPTPIHKVDVHGGYYTNDNVDTSTGKIRGAYILTMRFGGQQGAGLRALVSQQCFVSNLGIPAHIVEPFVINSALRHTYPDTNDTRKYSLIKFSDMFNIDIFNTESIESGYGPLVRWEQFLNSGPDRAILVELQSGGQKSTDVVWDGYSTQDSPCYKDEQYHKNVINSTLCLVRIVRICCVHSTSLNKVSTPGSIMTTKQLRHRIFGLWKSEQVTILFEKWSSMWCVPATCKHHSLEGKVYPSEQIRKYANAYRDTFLKSKKVVAFVLRFEKLLLRNYNVDVCLRKFRQVHVSLKSTLTNASVFVTADLGRYHSGSWGNTFDISGIDQKGREQMQSTFMNALSDFIDSQWPWKFDEWDNSFSQVTGGIEDVGYIAALQRSIASTADCLVFLMKGDSAFQELVKEEYYKYHPTVSEQCIHYLCMKDCPNCTHFYTKLIF